MWSISARLTRLSRPVRRHSSTFRPCVEALEDRCVPATAGSLDPTFGNGAGYVTTSTSPYCDVGATALIQPNGDIIAAGRAGTSSGSSSEFGVVRYNPDGSLDTTFGSGGIALANFGSVSARGPSTLLYPQAGLATDGDILQAGQNGSQLLLARYTSNGALDTSFGTGGEVESSVPGMSSILKASAVLTSNGQVMAYGDDQSAHFVLARYNSNGTLDTTFGQQGYVITSAPEAGQNSLFPTLLQQPNGELIVATSQSGTVWDLYRFNVNGTLDTSFGNHGIVTTYLGGPMNSAVLYPTAGTADDGKILVLGQSGTGMWDLARYNANGSLDATFGTGGELQTQISTGIGNGGRVTLDANERIVAAGGNSASTATILARFNNNGTLDPTFGSGGLVTTAIGTGSYLFGVAVYPNAGTANDGDIVAVGQSIVSATKSNFLVARYLGQANSPYFVVGGSSSLTAGTAGTFTISVLNPNGSTDTGYSGTVQITSSDPQAMLPANFTISGGITTFSATLKTADVQSLTATDTVTPAINGSELGIQVTPAAATHFVLSGPSSVRSGSAFSLTVTAVDVYGNVATGYVGTVHFTDSVSGATLPGNYTFTAADAGVHTFTGLKLRTNGTQTIMVTDTLNNLIIGSWTINVT